MGPSNAGPQHVHRSMRALFSAEWTLMPVLRIRRSRPRVMIGQIAASTVRRPTRRWWRFVLLAVVLVVGFLGGGYAHRSCWFPFCGGYHTALIRSVSNGPAPEILIPSSLHTIRVEQISVPASSYGFAAIDEWRDGWIVADKDGALHFLDGVRRFTRLPISVPFRREAFEVAVGTRSPASWFAVKDVRVVPSSGGADRLLASYHHWNPERSCATLRVSMTSLGAMTEPWTQVFESIPCLPLKAAGWPFGGHQAAGRIELLAESVILLSVGDHEYDGSHGPDYPQDTTVSYGKIWRIDLNTGEARIFTRGHRNPQGLHIDYEGAIWETEHGPTGGDELNLLLDGENYGWPLETYGTAGTFTQNQGTHPAHRRPVLAWVPSIGISQVIRVRGDGFSKWRGDVLVSSLRAETLFRVHIERGAVAFVEPIEVGERIRDVMEARDGTFLLLTEGPGMWILHPIR